MVHHDNVRFNAVIRTSKTRIGRSRLGEVDSSVLVYVNHVHETTFTSWARVVR